MQVQNIDLHVHAHTHVKSGDVGLLWNITMYWVSKGLQENKSKYIFASLSVQ